MGKVKLYILLGLIVLVGLVILSGCGISGDLEDMREAREAEEEVLRSSRSEVENLIADNVDMDTGNKNFADKIQAYRYENNIMEVDLIARNTGLADATKDTVLRESKKVIEAFYTNYPDLESVSLTWDIPLKDDYGNEELLTMLLVTITRATAEKINWEGFQADGLKNIADEYWEAY